jgi:GrpB-like predicted nucleotidyltransferase (UPF0157 family)
VRIGQYCATEAHYVPYDSASPHAASLIVKKVLEACSDVRVEHIGSTSVPGCAGKGIIDLLLMYRAGMLELAREELDQLGFQRQGGPDPFPENRPMRVASVEHVGRRYAVHVHVVENDSDEARDLLKFRDLLRRNEGLRRAYEMEKRAILARGISKSNEYSNAKGDFIRRVLAAAEF